MFDSILHIIRTRSREQWQQHFMERWIEARGWIQENGELAAVVSLFVGILLVLLFRVVLFLLAVGVIAAFVFWQIAQPREDPDGQRMDSPKNPAPERDADRKD